MGSLSLLQRIFPTQGSNPDGPTFQVDSLPAEPPGKPMNSGVGSLSLLQGIFPTQELNQGFLHCRRILYQLSYQGSLIQSSANFFFFIKTRIVSILGFVKPYGAFVTYPPFPPPPPLLFLTL